ncbi:MAG TPA: hypothetical protein VFM88_15740 [Vicinamibacteria bacterium]|nr:hypothetical protein [Vicinamibacteria bacterium]
MGRLGILLLLIPLPAFAAGGHPWCGTTPEGGRDAIARHLEERERRGVRAASAAADADVGNIAVLEDRGDLAAFRNPVDLANTGIEFRRSGSTYTANSVTRPVTPGATATLALGDDAHVAIALPFPFPFYGRTWTSAFVNSDGNLTFGAGESASTDRNLGRMLSGPPRVAPLLADVDPSAGGTVTTHTEGDAFRVTWTNVPQWGKTDQNTFQVTLFRDGRVQFSYGELGSGIDGVAGIAPGHYQGGFTPIDASNAVGAVSGGAMAEGFRNQNELDLVAVARRFYATHGDDYQQLVVFTSQSLVGPRTFAYEINIKNSDTGTGNAVEDLSGAFGSQGRLESMVHMDVHTKYSADPAQRVNGEDTTLGILAHEVGHRWLARARFRDGERTSDELLGRQGSHWSFFVDTDGSHDEGNDISDGGGTFRTVGSGLRYSPLDQYLMGLRRPDEVPPFFLVRNPTGLSSTSPAQAPQTGVNFSGTRRDVAIAEVIAAMGSRNPGGSTRLPAFRQAFLYVAVGGPADANAVAKLDAIRQQWPGQFQRSTDGRRAVETRLNP